MKTSPRLIVAKWLMWLVLPLVLLGLIDPLEGGIALLFAALVYSAAFLSLGSLPKLYLWLPYAFTLLAGAIVLAWAVTMPDRTIENGALTIPVAVGIGIYSVGVIATFAGGVLTAIRTMRQK